MYTCPVIVVIAVGRCTVYGIERTYYNILYVCELVVPICTSNLTPISRTLFGKGILLLPSGRVHYYILLSDVRYFSYYIGRFVDYEIFSSHRYIHDLG